MEQNLVQKKTEVQSLCLAVAIGKSDKQISKYSLPRKKIRH